MIVSAIILFVVFGFLMIINFGAMYSSKDSMNISFWIMLYFETIMFAVSAGYIWEVLK